MSQTPLEIHRQYHLDSEEAEQTANGNSDKALEARNIKLGVDPWPHPDMIPAAIHDWIPANPRERGQQIAELNRQNG